MVCTWKKSTIGEVLSLLLCYTVPGTEDRFKAKARHLERRLAVSGLQRGPGCHPERSEGSLREARQTLRCAQGDRPSLQMSKDWLLTYQPRSLYLYARGPLFPCRGSRRIHLAVHNQNRACTFEGA